MSSEKSRIPRDIKSFVPYMQDTDDYQLDTDPVTTHERYLNWNWTSGQSAQWTDFREQSDLLFKKYNNKLKRSTDDTNNMHLLISTVVQYDKDNHLLDKIAATAIPPAVLKDFETFHVKRGTPLADATPTRVADGMSEPAITMKKNEHLQHTLGVSDPNKVTKGKDKNIRDVQVWRAITDLTAAAPAADAYTHLGDASRGIYKSEFDEADINRKAWYKARYKNTQNKYGEFSVVMGAAIL